MVNPRAIAVAALTLALAGNVLLYRIAGPDAFATIISIASGLAALALAAGYFVTPALVRYGSWLAVGVWAATVTELALDEAPRWETQVRIGTFLLAFLLITVALYLAEERARVEHSRA